MATSDAVRDTIDTIVYLLSASLSPLVAPSDVFAATPDDFGRLQDTTSLSVTVFLYRIAVNPTLRNTQRPPLPNGRMSRPLVPLELGLFITPWARETRDEHRLIGRIIQALYDHSEMGPADLQGTSWEPGDTVSLILESQPTEEHFRIWETTELPYRLSLTYQARVIGIEPGITSAVPVVASAELRRG